MTELFELSCGMKAKYLEEMALVAEAVANAFDAEKMNYELLGNGDSHIHWHLFPRRSGDLGTYGNNGKGPVWWLHWEIMNSYENRPSAWELEEMKESLNTELNRLL